MILRQVRLRLQAEAQVHGGMRDLLQREVDYLLNPADRLHRPGNQPGGRDTSVEDARGLPRKNSSVRAWMAVRAGLGCSMTAKRSTPANSPAPSAALAAMVGRSPMAADRQYCSERRNGRPASNKQSAPSGISHSGCRANPAGSASHLGTERAAIPPS